MREGRRWEDQGGVFGKAMGAGGGLHAARRQAGPDTPPLPLFGVAKMWWRSGPRLANLTPKNLFFFAYSGG